MGEWVQGGLLALGCQWREGSWCMPTLFLSPMPMPMLWAQMPMEIANGCGSMLSGSVRSLRLSALRCSADWGELCFSSGTCGWLTHLLQSVKWSGGLWCWRLSGLWSSVGNACGLWFIRLLGRGLLFSRPFPKLSPPSGLPCMILPGTIGQSQQRAGMKLALIILSCLFASRLHRARA
jgi:hypothetical protein